MLLHQEVEELDVRSTYLLPLFNSFADVRSFNTCWGSIKATSFPSKKKTFQHLLHPKNYRGELEFYVGDSMSDVIRQTEHPTLCLKRRLPQSNAHPSHKTPADRSRGVGLSYDQLPCRAFQRRMQRTEGERDLTMELTLSFAALPCH